MGKKEKPDQDMKTPSRDDADQPVRENAPEDAFSEKDATRGPEDRGARAEKKPDAEGEQKRQNENDAEAEEASKKTPEEALAALNNRYLRVCADFDNYRRRAAKEKEMRYDDGVMDTLRELMPVVDSMDAAVKAAEKWRDVENGKEFADGLTLIMAQWNKALEKLGIKEIPGEGSTFDPAVHQVVVHVEDDAYGENTVIEVFRKGYVKGDRVIRHSMVKVAN